MHMDRIAAQSFHECHVVLLTAILESRDDLFVSVGLSITTITLCTSSEGAKAAPACKQSGEVIKHVADSRTRHIKCRIILGQ
jgi:hypothetical protein